MRVILGKKTNSVTKVSGFTLIELMIALAIIGVLVSFAIPAYNGYIRSARIAECANEVTAIGLAQKQYYLENNRYFPNPDGTVTTVGAGVPGDYTLLEAASEGYFRSTYREHGGPATPAAVAHINCDYNITTGVIGGLPSYTITVTATPLRNLRITISPGITGSIPELAGLTKTVN